MTRRLPFRPSDALWSFETKSLCVAFFATPEDLDPEDHFQFPEDVEFASKDDLAAWFQAWVVVYAKEGEGTLWDESAYWRVLAYDTLGACSYRSIEEFLTAHRTSPADQRNTLAMKAKNTVICHYFPSMVAEACASAREELARLRSIRVREDRELLAALEA